MSELAVQLWTKTTGLPLPQSFLNKLAPSLVTMNGFRIVFAAGVFVFAPSACAGPLAAASPAPAATDTTDFRTFRLCITLLRKTVHKEHEESQKKKLFASLRELCGHIILFRMSQCDMSDSSIEK